MASSDKVAGGAFFAPLRVFFNSSASTDSVSRLGVEEAPRGDLPSRSASSLASKCSRTAPGSDRSPAGRVGQWLGRVAAIGSLALTASSQESSHTESCSSLSEHSLSRRAYHPDASLAMVLRSSRKDTLL